MNCLIKKTCSKSLNETIFFLHLFERKINIFYAWYNIFSFLLQNISPKKMYCNFCLQFGSAETWAEKNANFYSFHIFIIWDDLKKTMFLFKKNSWKVIWTFFLYKMYKFEVHDRNAKTGSFWFVHRNERIVGVFIHSMINALAVIYFCGHIKSYSLAFEAIYWNE